jgi:hypothetical protein
MGTSVIEAPWGSKAAEPERTPDGLPIKRTRYGAFVQREDEAWVPYYTPEEEWYRTFGRARTGRSGSIMAGTSWSPWQNY